MRARLRPLLRTRLAQGTIVTLYGTLIQLAVQFATVPVLAAAWGEAALGRWLMLITIPALFALSDLGVGTAAGNRMTELAVRGERAEVASLYAALRRFVLWAAVAAALVALVAGYLAIAGDASLEASGDWLAALGFITAYGYLAVANAVNFPGYQAADRYAQGGWIFQTFVLAEGAVAIAAAALGGTPAMVAGAMFGVRLVGTTALRITLRRGAPWLFTAPDGTTGSRLRALARPALAVFVLPIGQGLSLQGAVLALGAISGAAAVPAFALTRTLCRMGGQVAFQVSRASMPRYTVTMASGERDRADEIMAVNLLAAIGTILPAALGLLVAGQWFLEFWTGGRVTASFTLIALIAATLLCNLLWAPVGNLLVAINQQERFTYAYCLAGAAAVAAGAWLATRFGAEGMAAAMLALDMVMVAVVWRAAARLDLLSAGRMRAALARVHRIVRGGAA